MSISASMRAATLADTLDTRAAASRQAIRGRSQPFVTHCSVASITNRKRQVDIKMLPLLAISDIELVLNEKKPLAQVVFQGLM